MKKAIALLLALVTLLSLTACAGKEDTASSALDQIKEREYCCAVLDDYSTLLIGVAFCKKNLSSLKTDIKKPRA